MYRDTTSTAAGAASTGFVDQVVLTDPNQSVPFILSQPFNVYAPQGGRTCLTFDVVGQAPLTYQWKQGSTILTNGTSRDLLILPVPATNTSYTCTISNGLGSITTNSATVFVTPTATADSLANALESSVLGFGTQPTLGWSRQTTVTHDGVDALKSGAIGNGASSVLQTCVTGPATVKFWWKVSSEEGYDYLDLNQDGANRQYLTGEQDWQETETYVYSGSHIVEWKYSKDSTGVDGTDAGYVDGITLIPNGFAAWRAQQFSIAQQNAAGITSALDDPDHDGLNNLLEYALGLNPNINSRAGLPTATVVGANIEYTYVDDWDHLDMLLVPEISTTLNGTWTAVTPTEVSVTGSLHSMKVTLPIASDKNFLRLRITEF